jgi:cation/acetate symporter
MGTTGLLTFEDKTVTEKFNIIMTHQKMLLFLAEQEAKGNKGSEPTIDKDIMVLANPEIADLPNWVIALVAAGALAAALSTARVSWLFLHQYRMISSKND